MNRNLNITDRPTLLLILGVIIMVVAAFSSLLDVVVVAASFAVVLIPLHRLLSQYIRPAFSSLVITIGVVGAILGSLWFTLVVLYRNTDYIIKLFSAIFDGFSRRVEVQAGGKLDAVLVFLPDLKEITLGMVKWLEDVLVGYITVVPMMIIKILILVLSLYLLILGGEKVISKLGEILPIKVANAASYMGRAVVDTLYSIYVVHVAIALVVFLLSFPFFTFLGYGHVLFFSIMTGVFALIPIFGPVMVIAFLAVYALAIGDYRGLAIILVVGWPLLCAIPDWGMRPVLMGRHASINAVLMFIAFFGGIAVMGLLGFILGPVFITLLISAYNLLTDRPQVEGVGE